MRGTEVIQVHRLGAVNRFNERTFAAPRTVTGVILVPRTEGGEIEGRQSTTIVGLSAFCPPGTDIKASDEVTARGVRWQVDGEPGDYRSVGGQRKTVAVNLRRVVG